MTVNLEKYLEFAEKLKPLSSIKIYTLYPEERNI